jgi:hypothetical protein
MKNTLKDFKELQWLGDSLPRKHEFHRAQHIQAQMDYWKMIQAKQKWRAAISKEKDELKKKRKERVKSARKIPFKEEWNKTPIRSN